MSERWKPSVTVAAVIERDGRFMLVEEETAEGLKLNNPAGHLDLGESPEQAVVREALEETGCVFTPEALVGLYMSRFIRTKNGEDVTYLRLAYCGQVGDRLAGRTLDEGIVRTLWMSREELLACPERHRSPLLMRCIDDYLAGVRYPMSLVTIDPSLFNPETKR